MHPPYLFQNNRNQHSHLLQVFSAHLSKHPMPPLPPRIVCPFHRFSAVHKLHRSVLQPDLLLPDLCFHLPFLCLHRPLSVSPLPECCFHFPVLCCHNQSCTLYSLTLQALLLLLFSSYFPLFRSFLLFYFHMHCCQK